MTDVLNSIAAGAVSEGDAEALKVVLVVFLASYLGEQYPALRAATIDGHHYRWSISPRILGPILLMWGLSVVLLVWQILIWREWRPE